MSARSVDPADFPQAYAPAVPDKPPEVTAATCALYGFQETPQGRLETLRADGVGLTGWQQEGAALYLRLECAD